LHVRPEKNHKLQLQALAHYLSSQKEQKRVKLVLIGSCRNSEDEKRVEDLKSLARKLEIEVYIFIFIFTFWFAVV